MTSYSMKSLVARPYELNKIEFWAATTIFAFAVFFLVTTPVRNEISEVWTPNRYFFDQEGIVFNYYQHYFFPQLIRYLVLYLSFLLLNFRIIPRLISKQAVAGNIVLLILTFLLTGFLFGTADTYYKNYLLNAYALEQDGYNAIFRDSFIYAFWLISMFGFYSLIKHFGFYLLNNAAAIQSKYSIITAEGLTAFVLWMISMFLLLLADAEGPLLVVWAIMVPSAIFLYLYAFQVAIPAVLHQRQPFRAYLAKITLLLLVSLIPAALLGLLLLQDADAAFAITFFNVLFQLMVTAPLSWWLFKRHMKGKEALSLLQRELGQSHASFDFLRSQINPHFLFNALNTIYGTAIQENASRTSEGIEKLGDMMRFMLQENMQEKISLAREIDYLNNYISLQKLRTDPNPNIRISAGIVQPLEQVQISPMLLIPFVENAFKHGISFREPSHINVSLELKDQVLYFDVYNSKHQKQDHDPEKNKSGIGLANVKQRLLLQYPGRHELLIRETAREYFIHLTIQLS